MRDPYHAHTILASMAAFVGVYQLTFRWQWSNFMALQLDRIALRLWSISTCWTAFVIAYAMYQARHYPIDKYFWMACGVVILKGGASVASYYALSAHIKRFNHPTDGIE